MDNNKNLALSILAGGLVLGGLYYLLTADKKDVKPGNKPKQDHEEVKVPPTNPVKVAEMHIPHDPENKVEPPQVELDDNIHTREKLKTIIEASLPEYNLFFSSWYRMGVKMSEGNKQDKDIFSNILRAKLYQALQMADEDNARKLYNFDMKTYKAMFAKFAEDPEIKELIRPVEENLVRVSKQEMPILDLVFPEGLDFKQYLTYIQVVYEHFRWKIYCQVQQMDENARKNMNPDELMKVVKDSNLNQIKEHVWRKLEMPEVEGHDLKDQLNSIQAEIHLKYEKLAEELSEIQRKHKAILMDEIAKGEKIESLEGEDPLETFMSTNNRYPFHKQ